MDFLKKAQASMAGSSSKPAQPAAGTGTAAPAEQKDYGDKGMSFTSLRLLWWSCLHLLHFCTSIKLPFMVAVDFVQP